MGDTSNCLDEWTCNLIAFRNQCCFCFTGIVVLGNVFVCFMFVFCFIVFVCDVLFCLEVCDVGKFFALSHYLHITMCLMLDFIALKVIDSILIIGFFV